MSSPAIRTGAALGRSLLCPPQIPSQEPHFDGSKHEWVAGTRLTEANVCLSIITERSNGHPQVTLAKRPTSAPPGLQKPPCSSGSNSAVAGLLWVELEGLREERPSRRSKQAEPGKRSVPGRELTPFSSLILEVSVAVVKFSLKNNRGRPLTLRLDPQDGF